jgi:hypothetical protein
VVVVCGCFFWGRGAHREPLLHEANLKAEESVDLADPLGVAAGEVIVDGHDVHAAAAERIEEGRQHSDQRLALARAHLRNLALVQNHAADELHIEGAQAEHAPRRLAHHLPQLTVRRERARQWTVGMLVHVPQKYENTRPPAASGSAAAVSQDMHC